MSLNRMNIFSSEIKKSKTDLLHMNRMQRKIDQDLIDKIVEVFPKDNTLAIIIFGSYGTDKQRPDSDIDIAWIPIERVPMVELSRKSRVLESICHIEVDLKIVTENYYITMLDSILQGDVIYEHENFYDYYSYFYFENSDALDVYYGGGFR